MGNRLPGNVVWVIDFAGFGIADCSLRTASHAVPMFYNHYPERFGQIVLFGMPFIVKGLYSAMINVLDPVTRRKIVILQGEEAEKRYAQAYWNCNPALAKWLAAALKCKGVPGSFPDSSLSRELVDIATRDILERCV